MKLEGYGIDIRLSLALKEGVKLEQGQQPADDQLDVVIHLMALRQTNLTIAGPNGPNVVRARLLRELFREDAKTFMEKL